MKFRGSPLFGSYTLLISSPISLSLILTPFLRKIRDLSLLRAFSHSLTFRKRFIVKMRRRGRERKKEREKERERERERDGENG